MVKKLWLSACILGTLAFAIPSFGQTDSVRLCHVTKDGVTLLHLSPNAVDKHLLHGDYPAFDIHIDGQEPSWSC